MLFYTTREGYDSALTSGVPLGTSSTGGLTVTHKFERGAAFRGRPRETLVNEITCGPSPERKPPLVHGDVGNGKHLWERGASGFPSPIGGGRVRDGGLSSDQGTVRSRQ